MPQRTHARFSRTRVRLHKRASCFGLLWWAARRFGKFYLYQLIESETESCKSVAIEVQGTACGFLNIGTDVDHATLTQLFDLSAYNGLLNDNGDLAAVAINLFAIDPEVRASITHSCLRTALPIHCSSCVFVCLCVCVSVCLCVCVPQHRSLSLSPPLLPLSITAHTRPRA